MHRDRHPAMNAMTTKLFPDSWPRTHSTRQGGTLCRASGHHASEQNRRKGEQCADGRLELQRAHELSWQEPTVRRF
jgi:hypothetical protein